MLKKSKPVLTNPPVSRIGNRQQIQSGRPLGSLPMRLVASGKLNEMVTTSQHLTSNIWHQTNHSRFHLEDDHLVGSIESWRLLLRQLSLLVGTEGSAAIFFHSIGQLSTQYPALGSLSPKDSWPEQLAVVQNTLQQLPQSSAAFARQSLWFRGCQLITKLLGSSLSRRLLHQVAAVQSSYHNG